MNALKLLQSTGEVKLQMLETCLKRESEHMAAKYEKEAKQIAERLRVADESIYYSMMRAVDALKIKYKNENK